MASGKLKAEREEPLWQHTEEVSVKLIAGGTKQELATLDVVGEV
jgi:hypothetical protein